MSMIDPDFREKLQDAAKAVDEQRASVLRIVIGATLKAQRFHDPAPRYGGPILTPADRRLAEAIARMHFGLGEGGLEVVSDGARTYELRPASAVRRV